MTSPAARDRIIHPIGAQMRARLDALAAGGTPVESTIPECVQAAINAGHVAQVMIFCDECGMEWRGDVIGATREDRFETARAYLTADFGWQIDAETDVCPTCAEDAR